MLAPVVAIAFLSFLAAPASAEPDTTIDSGPSGVSNGDVSFTFSSSEPQLLGFECRLDSSNASDWASCTSPQAYSNLSEGSHTFEVRAVDAAGNPDTSPATRTWTVDLTPPETTIDSGPSGPTNDASPSFGFSSRARGELRVPPRLEPGGRLSALQLAAALQLAGRRRPHLRGPGHRRARQHRPDPGLAQLHRRHRRPRDPRSTPAPPGRPTTPRRRSASPRDDPGRASSAASTRARRPTSSPAARRSPTAR